MTVYAWMSPDRNGKDGIMTVITPVGPSAAAFGRLDLAMRFQDQAQQRANMLGIPVRLAILEESGAEVTVTPNTN